MGTFWGVQGHVKPKHDSDPVCKPCKLVKIEPPLFISNKNFPLFVLTIFFKFN